MTGRRSTTANPPTPIEDVPPTAPPQPAPEPEPESEPEPDGEPTAEELDERAAAQPVNILEQMRRSLSPDYRAGYTAALSAAAAAGEYPLTVHEAIAEVTRRIEHIAKDRRAESGERYAYRGIDDVLLALHPLLGDVGLVLMPGRMIEHRRDTRATSKGGSLNVAMVRVRYRLIGPDGSATTGEAWGEAHDSGDKATQKALSQAYKSFALQTFSIPTEGSAEDEPDRTNEPGRPFTAEEQQRAANALSAALTAATVEELAGIRRRALALLAVPTHGRDNTLAPLSWHFEQRLTELDRAAGGAS